MSGPGAEARPEPPEDSAWESAPPKRHRLAYRSAVGNVLVLDPGEEDLSALTFPERMLSTVFLMSLVEHAVETYLETVFSEVGDRGVAWSCLIDGTHGPVRTLSAAYAAVIKRQIERNDGVLHEYVTIPADPGRWVLRELARLAGLRSPRRRLARDFRALASGIRGRAIEPDTGRFYVRIGQQAQQILVTAFRSGSGIRYVLRIGEIQDAEEPVPEVKRRMLLTANPRKWPRISQRVGEINVVDLVGVTSFPGLPAHRRILLLVFLLVLKHRATEIRFEPWRFEKEECEPGDDLVGFRMICEEADGQEFDLVPPPRWIRPMIAREFEALADLNRPRRRVANALRQLGSKINGQDLKPRQGRFRIRLGETVIDVCVVVDSSELGERYCLRFAS